MAEVVVNVKANTGQATSEVDDLNDSLNKTEKSSEDLSASLEKQEARIKTLGGAINIVGGSVEVLAGSLALSGALTEEQVQQFEAAAVGAIAFADGTKRVFEGVKELREGLALATQAQKANNLAVLANPYVAAAAALVALTAGLALYADATSEAAKQRKILTEIEDTALESSGTQIAQLEILKDRIEDTTLSEEARENALKKLQELIPDLKGKDIDRADAIKDVTAAIDGEIQAILKRATVAAAEERLTEVYKERFAIQQQLAEQQEKQRRAGSNNVDLSFGRAPGAIKVDIFADKIARLNKQLRESQDEINFISELIEDDLATAVGTIATTVDKGKKDTPGLSRDKAIEIFIKPKLIVPEGEDDRLTLAEYFEQQTGDILSTLEGAQIRANNFTRKSSTSAIKIASDNLFAYAELAEYAVGDSIDAFGQLFSALSDITGEGNEEAFEKGKKYKIAEVVTSSTRAAFDAFAAAQQFGPILGPILGAAQVAAISVAANRAIQDIRSATFEGGTPSTGGISAPSTPIFQTGTQTIGGATGTIVPDTTPQSSGQVTRAYVLSSDVANELEASTLLQNRRQFP